MDSPIVAMAILFLSAISINPFAEAVDVPTSQAGALTSIMTALKLDGEWEMSTVCSSASPEITCDSSGNIVNLNLTNKGLSGSIPSQIANLTFLTGLDLSGNDFSGSIPENLGDLVNLVVLNLANNNVSGTFPNFKSGNQLKSLNISGNSMGPHPWGFGILPNIADLDISRNQFEGDIPRRWSVLGKLQNLNVAHNNLTDIQPLTMLPSSLLTIDASNNNFTNDFFESVTSLTSLQTLKVSNNSFDGLLPNGFSGMSSLQYLDVSMNEFNNMTASSLLSLTALTYLSLAQNAFSPPVFFLANFTNSTFTNTSSLKDLDLSGNRWNSSIPPSIGNFTALTRLDLSNGSFRNTIPPQIANITTLQILNLASNRLNGTVPPQFGGMAALSSLSVADVTLYCPGTPAWGGTRCPSNTYLNNSYCSDVCPTFCESCANGAWSMRPGVQHLLWMVVLSSMTLFFLR